MWVEGGVGGRVDNGNEEVVGLGVESEQEMEPLWDCTWS